MRAIIGVILVALLLMGGGTAAAGGGGCHEPATSAESTRVVMAWNCYGPTVAHVDAGETVRFVNSDSWMHTVTGAGLAWGSPANIKPGGEVSVLFDEPGVFPYVCLLHPGMLGAVVVAGDDAAAATKLGSSVAPAEPLAEPGVPQARGELAAAAPAGAHGVGWTFALGLAALAAVVGAAFGALGGRPVRRIRD